MHMFPTCVCVYSRAHIHSHAHMHMHAHVERVMGFTNFSASLATLPHLSHLCLCVYTVYQSTPRSCIIVLLTKLKSCATAVECSLSLHLSVSVYIQRINAHHMFVCLFFLTKVTLNWLYSMAVEFALSLIHLPYPWSSLLLFILLLSGHWRTHPWSTCPIPDPLCSSLLFFFFQVIDGPLPYPFFSLILLLSGHWRTLALSLLLS
jgi:hypothetical protein